MNPISTYSLRINGNQLERSGNPLGFKRVLKQAMRADSVRYHDWQQFVRAAFYSATKHMVYDGKGYGAPLGLTPSIRARMDILISWSSSVHADPDNVWKGLADSLFADDKHVAGSFDWINDKHGYVDIVITTYNEEQYAALLSVSPLIPKQPGAP